MTAMLNPDLGPEGRSMRDAALWWAAKGVSVLPLHYPIFTEVGGAQAVRCSCADRECRSIGKHPLHRLVPHGLTDATSDPDVVAAWWAAEPKANIGVRTGESFDLIDIDSVDGLTAFGQIATELGYPENLGTAMSGRDGYGQHLYVVPGGQKALAGGKTAPAGIDVKGRGGYAVVAPSLHESGKRYRFTANGFETGEVRGEVRWEAFYKRLEIRPTPAARVASPTTVIPLDAANAYGRAVLARALSLVDGAFAGNRWQTLATEAIPLIARGVDGGCIDRDSAVRELETAARSAGLDGREVRRIGPLVDDMLSKGIRNPIRPREAAGLGIDLIAAHSAPTTRANNSASVKNGEDGEESEDGPGEANADPLTEPWEPPWPLTHPTPSFPMEVMGWMAADITGLAEQMQCAPDLVAMMTLATMAATVRGRIHAEYTPGWTEPLNLYIAVIQGPGETKSPPLSRIVAPLRELEEEAKEAAKEVISARMFDKDFAEQRAKKLRDMALGNSGRDAHELQMAQNAAREAALEAERITVPPLPEWLVGDMTPEALTATMAEQRGALAHLSAEGALLDTIVGGRYSNGTASLTGLLAAHDGREPIKVHRRSAPTIEVPNPCLTIGLAVQPHVLKGLGESGAAVGRGLVARFLFCIPRSLVGRRDMTLRRTGEEFPGFRALVRNVDRLARGGRGGSGDIGSEQAGQAGGSGDIGSEQASGLTSVSPPEVSGISGSNGPDRWRVSGRVLGIKTEISGGKSFGSGPGAPSDGRGSGDIGPYCYKYAFGESSSSLLNHYREDLEPRRAAETGDLGEIGPWANKLDGQLIRLATLLQVLQDADPRTSTPENPGFYPQNPPRVLGEVGPDAVAGAIVLVDYLIAHAVEAHALMAGQAGGAEYDRAKQLLGWVRETESREFTAHDAERSLRKRVTFREPGSVNLACQTLVRMGWIRFIPPEPGRPGRPSLRYTVHPDVFA